MKVLIIDNSNGFTGAYKSIVNVIGFVPEVNFLFASPSKKNVADLSSKHKSYYVPFVEIQKNWKLLIYFPLLVINSIRVWRIIRKEGIDVIHVNDLYNMVGLLVKAIKPSVKVIYHVRLLPSSYVGRLFNVWSDLLLRWADRVICVSNAVSDSMKEHPKKHVIHDALEFGLEPIFHQHSGNITRFLFPANFIQGKGHMQALEAFKIAYQANENIRMKFVGGDLGMSKNSDFRDAIVEKIKINGLQAAIEISGFAIDLKQEMEKHDVIVMLSESESFSMICLEAASSGKPVLATMCGGPGEIIQHGKTGWLVPVGDVAQTGQYMLEIARDPSELYQMGVQGYRYCKTRFDVQITSRALKQLYFQ